ncbi:MAG: sodium:proline symporter [Opitutaceae bacterium]|nr:sodium:proline symporter [Opitutaceae bacterium]
MHFIDWLVIIIPLLIILIVGIITHRQMKSVAHFISGGRVGGRYLLAVAKGEMQAGAVVFVAMWEVFAHAGFVPSWWGWITGPVGVIVAIFGFVIYRFRETRAMTLAQFFEMRYSRNFRSFTGVLGFLAGVINFGIIPAIGARFMVYFLQLPPEIVIGPHSLPTYIPLMGIFLAASLTLAISGGLITLMVTDCIEGIFSQLMYIVIIIGVLSVVGWSQMSTVLGSRPTGISMVNPFDAWQVEDFNLWYVLMGVFLTTYGTMAWQNSSAYNSAGATPHETRMSGILGRWRESGKQVVVVLLAAAAITYLGHADFSTVSVGAKDAIAGIAQPQIQKQMTIPIALSHLLPIGVKGALCAVLLFGIFGGDSTHLHSWGGILAQDIIIPRLKKAPTPQKHIRLLRRCIISVAVFAFVFGAFFRQTEYIVMWWSVTTAVYVGGAGSAIIGGLYWKKGTTAGAWAAVISGSILSGGGILAYKLFGNSFLSDWSRGTFGLFGFENAIPVFTLNGIQISFAATAVSIALYIGVSLATCRRDYPLNKMLHRDELPLDEHGMPIISNKAWSFGRIIGVNKDFSRSDKWITGSLFGWSVGWFSVMLIGTAWNLIGQSGAVSWIKPWSNEAWLNFWRVTSIGLPILITVITGVWFTWGGIHDIRELFRKLKTYQIDDTDNGTVKDHKPY